MSEVVLSKLADLRRRYGHLKPWTERGWVPVILGFIWTCIGVSYLFDPLSEKAQTALFLPLAIMPQNLWGCVFIFCGVFAAFSSRWPPDQDAWGFVALGTSAMWWGVSYFIGGIYHDGKALSGAAVWLALCLLLYVLNRVLPTKRCE